MESLQGLVPTLIKPEQIEWFREEALDFAHAHGLVIRTREDRNASDLCQSAPLALLPSPFPRKLFQQAVDVQTLMNLLYFRISFDKKFLVEAHEHVVHTDEFTKNMVDCFVKTVENGLKQTKVVLTQRADYMCHYVEGKEPELKQIEVNNIAVSMGALSQRASLWHRRALTKLGMDAEKVKAAVPVNKPVELLAKSLFEAWKSFGNLKAAILVVIEEVNQNQLDQKFIEYELEKLGGEDLKIIRATLTQCYERISLTSDHNLTYNKQEVGLVYFRAGYSPDNYPTDKEWSARLTLEQSTALKCPWIGLQLANTKKVQQVLDQAGIVEKYLPDQTAEAHKAVRATFADLWGLENNDQKTRDVIQDAMANPYKYVLKPQLEGGGGNFYGQQITEKLASFDHKQKSAHILMQRIQPLVVDNYHLRALHPVTLAKTVSELGVYGTLIGETSDPTVSIYSLENLKVTSNETSGHILRSKAEHVDEGGVAVGAAVIDTPFLV